RRITSEPSSEQQASPFNPFGHPINAARHCAGGVDTTNLEYSFLPDKTPSFPFPAGGSTLLLQ
ncbi:MAG: hypothetical protein NZ728_08335, partial [Oleiphilaceae bacterium]|nr:hypothetical protein [Oleiphilaceae bacterium]